MIYLLSASLVLFLAWPACHLLLRYTNRYALNRWLLLIALGLVTLLPLLPVQSPAPEATVALQGTIDYVIADITDTTPSLPAEAVQPVTGTTLPSPTEAETTSIGGYFSWEKAYLAGLVFFLAVLGIRLALLLTMHLRSRPNGDASYRLLHPSAKPGQAFSFGQNVYFSIDVPDSTDFDHILAHERVHARQGHSLDILLSEVFLCVFWFHPVAWWLRNKLRANLEYLVDAEVVNGGASRRDYQLALVRQSQITHNLALALPFSEPSLKGRISRMTGLPQHRVVALLATLALLFWVGVAGIVVYGTANSGYTGKAPFVEYYADQILSFNIYGKRAPTVDEYYQLRAILQHLPQTQLYLYKNTYDEGLSLRLDHWLNVPAVLHGISPNTSTTTYFRLGLETRSAPFSNPKVPRPTGGYFVPIWEQAINVPNGPDEVPGTMTISSETWEASQRDLKYQDFAYGEDFFVTINGRRFPLRPAETVPGPDGDEDLFLFDNGSVAPMTWTLEEYFAPYQQTATKRFNQLLGCTAEPDRGCPRSIVSIYDPSPEQAASWVAKNSPGKPFPIRAYYNDRPTTLEKLLSRQYGPNSILQVGYRTDKVTSYVVQVIDDSPAQIARVVREMNQVND